MSVINGENGLNLLKYLEVPQKVISEEVDSLENRVWIPDPDLAFRLCNIVEYRSDNVVVGFRDEQGFYEKRTVSKNDIQATSLSHYCDDMCQLTELNEASVLHTIKCRYDQKLIHTYSGLFCVVINPWTDIPLYTKEMMNFYMTQAKIQQILPPHVYSVAQTAYDGILKGGSNQSILITGESGAGKTENTKKIIEYLIFAAEEGNFCGKPVKYSSKNVLDSALISCGIALEAFSNAKTIHNNNSSRVGKFIRIEFNQHGKIHSAQIHCYLLEKSRVVSQNKGDRNFHIFYQLLSESFSNTLRKNLGIEKKACDYRFLNQGAECHDHGIDDATCGQETDAALDRIGLSIQEKHWVYEIAATCILIGEMRFGERVGMDMSYPESMTEINKVAQLLNVKSSKFVDALTQPSIKIGENIIRKNQSLKKTLFSVAALTKIIYERLFGWIVSKCNAALEKENPTDDSAAKNFIGVLDMAGFEIMNYNSFEQFCINYTNEKLQQFFNHFMFIREQTEYLEEGIEWSQVNYADDLQPTIEMIEKPMGLLSYLQEECIVPNGSDNSLLEKLIQNLSSTSMFSKSKQSTRNTSISHFTICHYAGQVAYNIDGWIEKNRDVVDQSILEVLGSCQHPLVARLFPPIQIQENSRGRRGTMAINGTVSSIYKEQLINLLQTLHSTSAHFIRCIVPNYERRPFQIKGPLVLHQLRCNGVLEGVRICRRGYPNRLPFDEFIQRYKLLAGKDMVFTNSRRETSSLLFEKLRILPERYQLGKNKVFCRVGVISELEARRKEHIQNMIVGIQAWSRWYIEQKVVDEKYDTWDSTITIQKNTRQYARLVNWEWYYLWQNVRQLIPMARDKKLMAQLQKDNEELVRLCEDMRNKNHRLQATEKIVRQEMEKIQEERIEEKQHLEEIRHESKKNEDLLELMAKRFDEQHQKIMRMHTIQKDNEKALERMEDEKKTMQEQIDHLKQKYRDEKVLRENMEEEYKDAIEKAVEVQDKMDKMLVEMDKLREKCKEAEEKLEEWKGKSSKQSETISELQATISDLNDRIIHFDSQIHNERNIRRKCEDAMDELEDELQRLHEDLEKSNVKNEAMQENIRVKENAIKRLEKKLEDKTDEMDSCIVELKKIHKASYTEMQNQLDEYKRKCLKLESENKQQKVKLDSHMERESSVDYDYQTASLGRNKLTRQNSNSTLHTSTNSLSSSHSTRTLNSRSEYGSARSYTLNSDSGYGLHRTTSNSRITRTPTIMEIPSSGYGLTRSPSVSQVVENERKISDLERKLQTANTDYQLLKREIDVYRSSLQDTEREKETLVRQINRLNLELESNKKLLEKEEKNSQMLELKWRASLKDVSDWKQKYEDAVVDTKHELTSERKKHREKIEDLTHSYDLKLGHLATVEKCRDQMHTELMHTQQQLDNALARLNNMEKMSRSQANIGETWESQYRVAMQDIESLRDENAALKTKIRRQYKQIELLTQQSEIDERVSDLEIQVDKIHDRIQVTKYPVEEENE